MKQLLYTPCAPKWILSDIIYIYTLEPTSFRRAQTDKLIQKTVGAGNLADRMFLNAALKKAAASNILFLISALVIGGGLCYAINWYKEKIERKKAAALSLPEAFFEESTHDRSTGRDKRIQDTFHKGNAGALLENQYVQ
jgi:hypothetical protein